MTHPIANKIIDLANPIAIEMGLEVVAVVFQTNKNPPILRVDVRNITTDTSLDDCEKMSRALETLLDSSNILEGTYVLEISSPGISRQLTTDREFIAFKGFTVMVKTYSPYQGQKEWIGRLQGRDEAAIHINQKGKAIAIPRQSVAKVQLIDQE